MARTLSIELGAYAVKVMAWESSVDDPPEAEVAQIVDQDGEHTPSVEERLEALDRVMRAHPDWSSGAHVVVTWPAERVAVHRVVLPFDDEDRIGQTLPFTLESEVPFDLDPMIVAWRKGFLPGEVIATLARRDELEPLLEALESRGLAPRKVVCAGDALAWYADPGLDPDRVVAVIDVGHENTVVAVVKGGITLAWRPVAVAGRAATRAIQVALGVPWLHAQALKHGETYAPDLRVEEDDESGPALFDPSDDPSTQTEVTDPKFGLLAGKGKEALDGVLGTLLAEVRATLVRFEDDLGVGVDEVVLTGGSARLKDLAQWIGDDLGLPVRSAFTPAGQRVPDGFAVVRAVGVGHAAGVPPLTNLRIDDLAYKGGLDNLRAVFGYGGAFVSFFLAAVVLAFTYRMFDYSSQQTDVEERVRAEVGAIAGEVPEDLASDAALGILAELVAEATEEAEFLGSTNEAPPTVDLLYQLTKAFPPHPDVKVEVDLLDITENAVKIEGTTEGFSQVDRIGESLASVGTFGRVEATPGNKDGRGRLGFTVDIDRGATEEDTDAGDEELAPEVDAGEEG